jgi:hypothetical protein
MTSLMSPARLFFELLVAVLDSKLRISRGQVAQTAISLIEIQTETSGLISDNAR